ncbi:MAG: hypothetical protein M0P71_09630 [Melioribacteraceae bacterium]|nr:hypothetical protein [Melioribacteraceae bacterium]
MPGELIPIIMFLVVGLVLIMFFYFRSKERTLMLEKGLTAEQMLEFYKTKPVPYLGLKFGIITIFFGIGLGVGLLMEGYTSEEAWIPFLLITLSGLGFVIAHFAVRELEKKDKKENLL